MCYLWGRCLKTYSCLGNIPHSTSPNCFFPPGAISASDLKKVSSSWDPKLFILYALGPENTYTLTNLLSIPLASLSLVSMCCYWKILSVWPPIQPSHPKMSLQPLQKYLKITDVCFTCTLAPICIYLLHFVTFHSIFRNLTHFGVTSSYMK